MLLTPLAMVLAMCQRPLRFLPWRKACRLGMVSDSKNLGIAPSRFPTPPLAAGIHNLRGGAFRVAHLCDLLWGDVMSTAAPDPPSELTPPQRRERHVAILARAAIRGVRLLRRSETSHSARGEAWGNPARRRHHCQSRNLGLTYLSFLQKRGSVCLRSCLKTNQNRGTLP